MRSRRHTKRSKDRRVSKLLSLFKSGINDGYKRRRLVFPEQLESRQLLTAALGAGEETQMIALLEDFGPTEIANSVNAYLTGVEDSLRNAIEPAIDLPVIGDRVSEGVQPLFDSLAEIRADVSQSVSNAFVGLGFADGTNIVDRLQTSLFTILGPQGLDVLLDGPDVGSDVNSEDICLTYGVDLDAEGNPIAATDYVQWDLRLGQRLISDFPFDIGLGLDNLFEFEASGEVRFDMRWDLQLGFGLTFGTQANPQPQFFLSGAAEDPATGQDVEELRLSVDVYAAPPKDSFGNDLPLDPNVAGLSAEVTVGLNQGRFTDGTASVVTLTGTQPIDLLGNFNFPVDIQLQVDHASLGSRTVNVAFDTIPTSLVASLNAEINAAVQAAYSDQLSPLPIGIIPDFSSVDLTGETLGPSLKFIARTPDITGLTIFNADELGFELGGPSGVEQRDDQAATSLGFRNGQTSTLQAADQVLLAALPAPSNGQLPNGYEIALSVGGQAIDVSVREAELATLGNVETTAGLVALVGERAKDRLERVGFVPVERNAEGEIISENFSVALIGGKFEFRAAPGLDSSSPSTAPQLQVQYNENNRTRLTLAASLDLSDPGFDESSLDPNDQSTFNRLYASDIGGGITDFFEVGFEADADIRLHVDAGSDHVAGFLEESLGLDNGSLGLPSIGFDFELDASVSRNSESGEFESDISNFVFANVRLDVGDLLENIAVPIANTIGDVLGPVTDIIGDGTDAASSLLTEPLPLVSDFGDDVTLTDILGEDLSSGIDGFISSLGSLVTFAGSVTDFLESYNGDPIDFGCFEYNTDTGLLLPCEAGEVLTTTAQAEEGIALSEFLDVAPVEVDTGGFSIDILSFDSVANMLIGQPFDIISFDLPSIDFEASLDVGFSFFAGALEFDLEVGAGLQLASLGFGYDSAGIQSIIDAKRDDQDPNFLDLVDGLYIKNQDGPEIAINVFADGGITIGPGFADAHLNTFLELDIQDPNEDGKLRLDEVFEVTNDFSNPENLICLFDIAGGLDIGFEAGLDPFGSVGFDVEAALSLQGILESITGVDCGATVEPILATPLEQNGESVLRINSGVYANERLFGDTNDNSDQVAQIVENADGTLDLVAADGIRTNFTFDSEENAFVTAEDDSTLKRNGGGYVRELNDLLMTVQTYRSDGKIDLVADAFDRTRDYIYDSAGELDRIEIDRGVGSALRTLEYQPGVDISVRGDANQIIVSYSNDPNETIEQRYSGSFDKIVITGGEFADTLNLSGVQGVDVIVAGFEGNDTILGGSGSNTIRGGDGNDSLTGGPLADFIDGGLGNDTINAGAGDDRILGRDGNDTIQAGGGHDRVIAGRGSNRVDDGPGDDYVDMRQNVVGFTLVTGGGSDTIIGSAFDDTIDASASGGVRLEGRRGQDTLIAFDGDNVLSGGDGDDVLRTFAGTNKLLGGSGNDVLIVTSVGTNEALGGSGDDVLRFDEAEEFNALSISLTTDSLATSDGVTKFGGVEKGIEINSGGDEDSLTILETAAPVTIRGGNPESEDSLFVDLTSSRDNLTAELLTDPEDSDFGLIRIEGLEDIRYQQFENVTIELGQGADDVLIRDTFAVKTVVRTGDGNDDVTIDLMTGEVQVDGQGDTDSVILNIPGSPTNFPGLAVTVETLEIDNSQSSEAVEWVYKDGVVLVGEVEIVDALGADEVLFTGSLSGDDSLTVADTVEVPQRGELQANRAVIQEGFDVLEQPQTFSQSPQAYNVTVDGLDTPRGVAASSDNNHVYVAAQGDDSISVYRRNLDSTLDFIQVIKDSSQNDGLDAARDVLISPDGAFVYVSSSGDDDIAIFSRNSRTGRLAYVSRYNYSSDLSSMVMNANGSQLYVANSDSVVRFSRNSTTGELTFQQTINASIGTIRDIAYSPENLLFMTGSGGSRRMDISPAGQLTNSSSTSKTGYAIAVNEDGFIFLGTDGGVRSYNRDLTGPVGYSLGGGGDATAVVADESNDRILVGADANSAAFPDPTYRLRITKLRIINKQDSSSNDEPAILVNGFTYFKTLIEDQYGEGSDIPLNISLNIGAPFTIALYDEDNGNVVFNGCACETTGDDLIASGTYGLPNQTTSISPTFRLVDTVTGNDLAKYQLFFTIEVTPGPQEAQEEFVDFANSFSSLTSSHRHDIGGARHMIDSLDVMPNGSYYGTSSPSNLIGMVAGSGSSRYKGKIVDGQQLAVTPDLVGTKYSSAAVSPDGDYLYTLNSAYGLLWVSSLSAAGVDDSISQQLVIDGLADEASVTVSDGGQSVFVTNPTENTVRVFSRNASSGHLTLTQILIDGQSGVDGIAGAKEVATRGQHVYVAGADENAIAVFTKTGSTLNFVSRVSHTDLDRPSSIVVSENGQHLYVTSADNNRLLVFIRNSSGLLTHLQSADLPAGSLPQGLILSNDANQSTLYAATEDDTIAVYSRDLAGTLSLVQTVENNRFGVRGLDGLSDLAVSEDNQFVFAAGADADTVVVFARDAISGELTFAQRLRDGASGISGLENPTALVVSGERLLAARGRGGIVNFTIDTEAPTPNRYTATYGGIESLALQTAGKFDTIAIDRPVVDTTIHAGDGDDLIIVNGTLSGVGLDIHMGLGDDELDLRSANSSVLVYGNAGDDLLSAYNISGSSTLYGGDDDDTFIIDGKSRGTLTLYGGDGVESGSLRRSNDVLLFDTKGNETDPNNADGPTDRVASFEQESFVSDGIIRVLRESGEPFFGETDYSDLEELYRIAAPDVDIAPISTIPEGGSLELRGFNRVSGATSYTWDLNSDGDFGDAFGLQPDVSWDTLAELGLGDNGVYSAALRGEKSEGIDTAVISFEITNVAPTIEITAAPATRYVPFEVDLSATDVGDDTVIGYIIDWGDGSEATQVAGTQATVNHTYVRPGSFNVTVTAEDEDGEYQRSTSIFVADGPPPVRTLAGAVTSVENAAYQLDLQASGPLAGRSDVVWLVNWGDGTSSTFEGATGSLDHVYADDGLYRISATQEYSDGFVVAVENALAVEVANVAPTVHFSGPTTTQEGAAYMLGGFAASDPGEDTIAEWVVDWGDGQASTFFTRPETARHVYQDNGVYTVRVVVRDEDGLHASASSIDVAVANVEPTVTVTESASQVAEGSLYQLLLDEFDPGNDQVSEWIIDWGDGSPLQSIVPGAVSLASPFSTATRQTSVSHIYGDGVNSYPVTVTAIDEDGSYQVRTDVDVVEAPPKGEILDGNLGARVRETEPFRFELKATDPGSGAEDVIDGWVIDWGDGSQPITVSPDTTSVEYAYADDGEYTVSAGILQGDAAYPVAPFVARVLDVPPAVSLSASSQPNSGTPFELTVGPVIDPGADSIGEVRVYWGDGSQFDGNDYESFTAAGTFVHDYAESDQPRQLSVVLVDADDPSRTFFGGVLQVVNEGLELPLELPPLVNAGDRHSVAWGDGSSTEYTLTDVAPLTSAGEAASSSTLLNQLDRNRFDYVAGDAVRVKITNSGGQATTAEIAVDAGSTLGSLLADINATFSGVDVRLNAAGQLQVKEDASDDLLPIVIADTAASTGRTGWSQTIAISHTYADDGAYDVVPTVVNAAENATPGRSIGVLVNNTTPFVSIELPPTVEAGIANVTDLIAFSDLGFGPNEVFRYEIDWGDDTEIERGTATIDTLGQSGSATQGSVDGLHQFRQVGVFTVTVKIFDDDGASASASSNIEIANVAPQLESLATSSTVEGSETTLTGTIVDPGVLDTFTLLVNWGAPDSPQNQETYYFDASESGRQDFAITHRYLDDNVSDRYDISVTIIDNFDETNDYELDVAVQNAAPILSSILATPIFENGTTTLSGEIFDAGVQDSFTLQIDWGDPSSPDNQQELTYAANESGTQPFALEHQYYDDNATDSYAITLTLIDDDSGEALASISVTVENADPVLDAGANRTMMENTEIVIFGDFTDVGRFDTHTATIDWGDGTEVEAGIVSGSPLEPGEVGTVSGSHVYADDGQYTVTMTLTDKDGGEVVDTLLVDVLNQRPTLDAGLDQSTSEGSFITLDPAGFSDPGFDFAPAGTLETFEAFVDWGDGNREPIADISLLDNADGKVGLPTSGSINASHAYGDNGVYTVTVGVRDDDMPVGEWVTDQFLVTVENVAPRVDVDSINNSSPDFGMTRAGETISVSASFSDLGFDNSLGGTDERFTSTTIDWGDGTVQSFPEIGVEEAPGTEGVLTTGLIAGSHAYEDGGIYTITITLRDDDGGEDMIETRDRSSLYHVNSYQSRREPRRPIRLPRRLPSFRSCLRHHRHHEG
ncbi:MAG: PKD domain-containing protein [Planctomycetota bacterium]